MIETWRPGEAVAAPLPIGHGRVRPVWIDANGHMRLAAYAEAFAEMGNLFLEYLGLGYANTVAEGGSSFALRWHMALKRELHEGAAISFDVQVLDRTDKVFHYLLAVRNLDEGYLAATSEHLDIHVDLAQRRPAPMPARLAAQLDAITAAHAALGWPEGAGEAIAVRR